MYIQSFRDTLFNDHKKSKPKSIKIYEQLGKLTTKGLSKAFNLPK